MNVLLHSDLKLVGIEDPGFQDPANAVIIFDWDDTLLPTTCPEACAWHGKAVWRSMGREEGSHLLPSSRYILGTVIPSLPEEDRSGVLPENSEYQDRYNAAPGRWATDMISSKYFKLVITFASR